MKVVTTHLQHMLAIAQTQTYFVADLNGYDLGNSQYLFTRAQNFTPDLICHKTGTGCNRVYLMKTIESSVSIPPFTFICQKVVKSVLQQTLLFSKIFLNCCSFDFMY